jgi:hypothetical protein
MPAQCPNVRQCSSEQGLWTPAALRPAIWVKSNSSKNIIVSSGDGGVESVTDLSSGVPFSVTGSVKLDTSQLNSKPTLRIDNTVTAQLLTASYSYAGNEITLISLHRNAATAGGRTAYGRLFSLYRGPEDFRGTDGGILTYGVGGVNGIRFFRNLVTTVTSSPTINDAWGCAVLTRSGTGVTMALDGGSRVAGTTASNNFNFDKVRIGNDDGPREDSGMNGYVAENILITRAITQEEENKLFGYLAWEWGRVTSLPIDHPYRFSPPRDNRILTRKRRSLVLLAGASGGGVSGITGSSSVTLGSISVSQTGTIAINGESSKTLESISSSQTGTVIIDGASSIALGSVSVSQEGTVVSGAVSSVTLESISQSATGTVAISGASSKTLEGVSVSQDGTVSVIGASTVSLGSIVASATGTVEIFGSSEVALDSLSVAQAGTVRNAGGGATVEEIWAYEIEPGITAAMVMRGMLAYMAGDLTGGPDKPKFWNIAGTKVVIGGTADEDGNRTREVLDLTP